MNTNEIPVGIVGLGLMGCSIVSCLLIAGHPVIAIAPISADLQHAEKRIREHLENSAEKGIIPNDPEFYLKNLIITEDYAILKPCRLVNECTIENIDIKESVYKKIEKVISADALLTSNTSAIPISKLQKLTSYPERFLGLHWTEPAHTTRFLEIICGDETDLKNGEYLYELSHLWGKEPILVRKDIAGFITNRLMYAMYREAISLVENGYATIEDIDRSCRNNAGYFMTFVGVFRWMDLTGVPAYHTVMKNLLPTLNNSTEVPELIDKVVREGGRGVANSHGFYEYEPGEAEMWEETFKEFTYQIRELALKYPADIVKKRLHEKNNPNS
ncbi:3-hydroxyacyl-CoA dehydrogenase family protein [Dyadobacter sediminis]|uniref:3-hydroxyacyl-CoA dehydrogenase family protein n=1 Tax=Dyadobacter sediminis TaxID=1493691 RepID=A0A5R9KJV4_9BACT|nr:3-hydroxyacyl-CoA dehydrogenase family protein [Dyadobacter sediminis]TLU96518.1 3-hydroxyacyl-CoA dehydrogenase family protein [Dyadobacter sediminis]GGB82881.1 3-hydroxybutyryl-CoA dehydrogenase [Dyadobacter sediminis]